nr:uncharacterized protein LOC110559839 [Meriones unguiculatus]
MAELVYYEKGFPQTLIAVEAALETECSRRRWETVSRERPLGAEGHPRGQVGRCSRRRGGAGAQGPPPGAVATPAGPRARLHRPGCQARGAGGRKGWRCEGRRRAGTGAPRRRCNKNASHGTARGKGRDRAAAAAGGGESGGGRPGGGGGGREVKGLAKFSVGRGRRAPGEQRARPHGRSAGSRQAGYGPGAPAAPELPGHRQAGARRSPRRPARPRPAAPRSRRPLSEPGAPGGGRTAEPPVLPRTAAASAHPLPPLPGHGELRTAAAALGLLGGGRRLERSSWSKFPLREGLQPSNGKLGFGETTSGRHHLWSECHGTVLLLQRERRSHVPAAQV